MSRALYILNMLLLACWQDKDRLQTPGLFVNSVDLAHAVSPRSPASQPPANEANSVNSLRTLLDKGLAVRDDAHELLS